MYGKVSIDSFLPVTLWLLKLFGLEGSNRLLRKINMYGKNVCFMTVFRCLCGSRIVEFQGCCDLILLKSFFLKSIMEFYDFSRGFLIKNFICNNK